MATVPWQSVAAVLGLQAVLLACFETGVFAQIVRVTLVPLSYECLCRSGTPVQYFFSACDQLSLWSGPVSTVMMLASASLSLMFYVPVLGVVGGRRTAECAAVVWVSMGCVDLVLKPLAKALLIGTPWYQRPMSVYAEPCSRGIGMPSGHAAAATALALSLALLAPPEKSSRVAQGAAVWAAMVVLSRRVLQYHTTVQLCAGSACGVLVAVLCSRLAGWPTAPKSNGKSSSGQLIVAAMLVSACFAPSDAAYLEFNMQSPSWWRETMTLLLATLPLLALSGQ